MERRDNSIRNLTHSDHYTLALHLALRFLEPTKRIVLIYIVFIAQEKKIISVLYLQERWIFLNPSGECIMWFLTSQDV